MSPWVKNDPNAGGVKIPPAVQQQVKQRVLDYAAANYAGKYTRLDIRFRSQKDVDARCDYRSSDSQPNAIALHLGLPHS
jgi:hypothetical protein